MKLSEAMLKGCEMTPKCVGIIWDAHGATCALGAAVVGLNGREMLDLPASMWHFYEAFPTIPTTLRNEIFVRSDDGESRESIAAWLAEQGL